MAGNITSANSILALAVDGLFPVPQQLQGFSADDMYSVDAVDVTESMMGVDGKKSAGYIPQIKVMNVTLQADSDSNTFFEAIYAAQEAASTIYILSGIATQSAVSRLYTFTNGTIKNYTPLADAKKVLQPRKFTIEWESIIGAAI